MKKHKIKYGLVLFTIAVLLSGCKSYKFLDRGTITDDKYQQYSERQHYYNDNLKLTLDLYGDYWLYNPKTHLGLKTRQLYSPDKKILRQLGILKKDTAIKILFSCVPGVPPFFHVIAFLNTKPSGIKKSLYQVKKVNDTLLYYYRSINVKDKGMYIYASIIPYKEGEICFIYYGVAANCYNCDIELTELNAKKIVTNDSFLPESANNECPPADQKQLKIDIPPQKVLKKSMGFITISKPDTSEDDKVLVALKFLPAKVSSFSINVCKGTYTIMYMNLDHKLLWSGVQNIN